MKKPLLVLITGPTAVGKTDLSIDLAQSFDTEILSCDSRQFFKETKIGTAVPEKEQLETVKHHFIQHISVKQPYSVGKFEQDALQVLEELFKTKKIAFLVGGSGLYYNALLEGIDDIPTISDSVRDRVEDLFAKEGIVALQNLVEEIDPVFWEKVDKNNHRRLMRTIELFWETGKPLSYYQEHAKAKPRPFNILKIAIIRDREELYSRINLRVDIMLKEGLEQEVKSVYPYKHLKTLNTVGYKEFFNYFDGLTDKQTCIDSIKQNSRRYAKKQLTWIRRDKNIHTFYPNELIEIKTLIENTLHE